MEPQLYQMCLEDCACPSFCSAYKPFFGTLDEIEEFVFAHKADGEKEGEMPEIVSAFEAWKAGQKDVMHTVSYSPLPLLTPAKLVYRAEQTWQNYRWEHFNIWKCVYHMRCSSVQTEHRWVECEGRFMRCVIADFENLEWSDDEKQWYPVDEDVWGLCHMLCFENNSVRNRLAEPEKNFETQEKMQEDYQIFLKNPTPVFCEFCNEIFGDG